MILPKQIIFLIVTFPQHLKSIQLNSTVFINLYLRKLFETTHNIEYKALIGF